MDFKEILEQAKNLEQDLGNVQEELEKTEYTGTTGTGEEAVTVVVNGKLEVQSVTIGKALLGEDNLDMLQDMVLVAVNDALKKASDDRESKMGGLANGLDLSGLLG